MLNVKIVQRGSALIGVIIAMVITGTLGTSMYLLTSTSTSGSFFPNKANRALFLAESGIRYAQKTNFAGAETTYTMNGGVDSFVIAYDAATGKITSTGIADANSSWPVQRKITYVLYVLAPGGTPPPPEQAQNTPSMQAMDDASGNTSTGEFAKETLGGNDVLHVSSTTGGSGQGNQPSTEAYVAAPAGASNPIYDSWNGAGGYLSYDLQVKISTGTWESSSGGYFKEKPDTYCAGVIFRSTALSQQSTYYGLSFMRTHSGSGPSSDGIKDTMIPPASPSNEDKAMVVLWTRNGNQGNGDDNWLAYKRLDETGGTDYVVDSSGHVKDWSTIMARVVEAASLKLTVSSAPDINAGNTVTGGTGTAKIFRIINDSDGKVVLLLNNIAGAFTRPATVGAYSTDSTWGYRSRDNYVWAFYTETSPHSSPDANATNNARLGQTIGTKNWPVTDVQTWSEEEDKFSLVQWNSSLNTDQDSSLRIMGSGKEANGIIRTAKWTTVDYTAGSFPPEVGLVSLGKYSVKTYYADFSYFLRGGYGGGGTQSAGYYIY